MQKKKGYKGPAAGRAKGFFYKSRVHLVNYTKKEVWLGRKARPW